MKTIDKIMQAINTTLVIDNRISLWRCEEKIIKILKQHNNIKCENIIK